MAISKPSVGMTTIGMLTAAGDLGHFEGCSSSRPQGNVPPRSCSQISKARPSWRNDSRPRVTSRWYGDSPALADKCVVDAGGLVGRHAGDGVAAFFVAETAGSESAAARACIDAVRALQAATLAIAARHDLRCPTRSRSAPACTGAQRCTSAASSPAAGPKSPRSATRSTKPPVSKRAHRGGRALASKALLERLDDDDAAASTSTRTHVSYTQLADLDTATEKARRDAPAIAVCDTAIVNR